MKKILLLSMVFSVVLTYGQNAYYDSRMLREETAADYSQNLDAVEIPLETNQLKDVFGVLYKYLTPEEKSEILPDTSNIEQVLAKAFEKNPYLQLSGAVQERDFAGGLNLSKLSSSVAGLDVTTFADGLAQFLIERANEEINVWFFRKFREQIEDSEELRTVFPATSRYLVITEPYQYAQMINLLREAFRKDLRELIDNMEALATLDKYQELIRQHDELKVVAIGLAGASIVSKLKKGAHPADVIDSLGSKVFLRGAGDNLFTGVRLLSLVSQSVRDTTAGEGYVDDGAFESGILRDSITFHIYMGLIWQQCRDISFYTSGMDSITVRNFLADKKNVIISSRSFALDMVEGFNSLEEKFKALSRSDASDSADYRNFYGFYDALLDVVEMGIDAPHYFPPKTLGIASAKRRELQKFMYVARLGNEIFRNVNERNYSLAVLNFSVAYDTLFRENRHILNEDNAVGAFVDGRFVRYAAFMASVSEAESPADVKAAIRAAALPAGSSVIKRETKWNISINSYLGLHYGNEFLEDELSQEGKGWGTIIGFSAPVGLAVSKQLNFPFRSASISLYATLIDVGAVASLRLKNDSTEHLPEIKFENIIAPGLHLVYGIPKTPLSIGYGWQRGPQLREVHVPDPAGGAPINQLVSGYRWAFFLAVDIPLFNIYTRPR